MLCYTWGTFKERIGKHYEKNGIMRCVHALVRLFGWMQYDTTEQPGQGNPVIKEEISQPLGGSEALGNSEDSSALSAADKEKMFAPYEQYGMTYDAVKDELTYNGNLVRWFEDYYPISNNETAGIDFLNENGTVDVYAVRDLESFSKAADGSVDPAGKLIGLKEFTQQEFDARDIEALKTAHPLLWQERRLKIAKLQSSLQSMRHLE